MTQIKNYNFDENQLLNIIVDATGGQYIWIIQANNLKKVSVHNLLQVYFDLDVDKNLVKGFLYSSYLYFAMNDSSLLGRKYSATNPLGSTVDFIKPVGITEAPVDVVVGSLGVFFLIPGNLSGTNAKVVKMNTSGVYDQIIDLPTVNNAKSITVDNNNDLWIVTNQAPLKYIRVYLSGTWQYSIFEQ
jgi:hypothetical protein